MLRIEGVEDKVGRIDRFTSLAEAIEHFQKLPLHCEIPIIPPHTQS